MVSRPLRIIAGLGLATLFFIFFSPPSLHSRGVAKSSTWTHSDVPSQEFTESHQPYEQEISDDATDRSHPDQPDQPDPEVPPNPDLNQQPPTDDQTLSDTNTDTKVTPAGPATDAPAKDDGDEAPQDSATPGGVPSTDAVDWSRFAYTQYVTDEEYLCNSVMIFESLHRLGSKADRVMMYPSFMLRDPEENLPSPNARLLSQARDQYNVKLVPVEIEHREGQDSTWADSYTKLLAFNQTQYDRVLNLDSDSTVLQPMDELFLLPPCRMAMPRAYWLLGDDPPKKVLSSQIMLLQPSVDEMARVQQHIDKAGENEYDMEIVNTLYLDSALVLPHRQYDMLSAEFRRPNHADYLGSDVEAWDPKAVYADAKFVHFSDWPIPKPWIVMLDELRDEHQPKCQNNGTATEDCTDRDMWVDLYKDFAKRRKDVCGRDQLDPPVYE